MLLILDIDNTLACAKKRMIEAGQEPSRLNQAEYDIWLSKLQSDGLLLADEPIKGMLKLTNTLAERFYVVYLTGRSEKYRDETQKWLRMHGFPEGPLHMRAIDDYRTAREYKREKLERILQIYGMDAVTCDDDSDGDVEAVYRELGITHLKVTNNLG